MTRRSPWPDNAAPCPDAVAPARRGAASPGRRLAGGPLRDMVDRTAGL